MPIEVPVDPVQKALHDLLKERLIGPIPGHEAGWRESAGRPSSQYVVGCLYPRPAEEDDAGEDPDWSHEKPSSCGISFVVESDTDEFTIDVAVSAARYEAARSGFHRRSPLEKRITNSIRIRTDGQSINEDVLGEHATLTIRQHPIGTGQVVFTVAVSNKNTWPRRKLQPPPPEALLHEVQMTCRLEGARFNPIRPGIQADFNDEESDRDDVRFRDLHVYATGHGVATTWDVGDDDRAESVSIDWIPMVAVPRFEASSHDLADEFFSWRRLADSAASTDDFTEDLRRLPASYGRWIEGIQDGLPADVRELEATAGIIRDLHDCRRRIEEGIETLEEDEEALSAFRLANEAIGRQFGESGEFAEGGWRPFQLAFILMVIPSLVDPEHEHRRTFDLLWFPTGGGKTEAYLGLAAMIIFYRRLSNDGRSTGMAVLKRYTYRVLTFQQFHRCARLVCSMELIRRRREDRLGRERIRIGMWVGSRVTPNDSKQAGQQMAEFEEIFEKNPALAKKPAPIETCPWCEAPMADPVARKHGFSIEGGELRIRCSNETCPFGGAEGLPMSVTDTAIYRDPPEFLLATIDKFANVPWVDRAWNLFPRGSDAARRPLDLVIQDELHLINGPLGTLDAVYEAAFDVLWSEGGGAPKFIGATATIRRVQEQARRLYARKAVVFPPPAVDWHDSYFTRVDAQRPGRAYIGVLIQTQGSLMSSIRVSSLLRLFPDLAPSAFQGDHKDRVRLEDQFRTLVTYHRARREIGTFKRVMNDDVQKRMSIDASHLTPTDDGRHPVRDRSCRFESMSGETPSHRLAEQIRHLGLDHKNRHGIDVLGCTSIFSVGVDIDRLGLMMINGQSKGASEYIQATGRVGRSGPGAIVTHYAPTKPRDRAYYEDFRAFHEALQRSVEPVSVTPFADPALQRTLPSGVVSVIRHGVAESMNDRAREVSFESDEVRCILRSLEERLLDACEGDDQERIRAMLKKIETEWAQASGAALSYSHEGGERVGSGSVLCSFEDAARAERRKKSSPGLYRSMRSMRDVSPECGMTLDESNSGGSGS